MYLRGFFMYSPVGTIIALTYHKKLPSFKRNSNLLYHTLKIVWLYNFIKNKKGQL